MQGNFGHLAHTNDVIDSMYQRFQRYLWLSWAFLNNSGRSIIDNWHCGRTCSQYDKVLLSVMLEHPFLQDCDGNAVSCLSIPITCCWHSVNMAAISCWLTELLMTLWHHFKNNETYCDSHRILCMRDAFLMHYYVRNIVNYPACNSW